MKSDRVSFRKIEPVLSAPNLLDIQKKGYDWFVGTEDKKNSGIAKVFEEVGVVTNKERTMGLSFGDYYFEKPSHDIETCKKQNLTYGQELVTQVTFQNYTTEEIKRQTISLGEIPKMTPNGTFIVNGTERVIVSQIVRSPGVYFEKESSLHYDIYKAKIIPAKGAMMEFEIDKNGVLTTRLDRKRKQSATVLLKALNIKEEEIKNEFRDYPIVLQSIEGDGGIKEKEDALIDIFRKNKPGEPSSVDAGALLLYNYFFNKRRYDLQPVGRYKLNNKLGLSIDENKNVLDIKDIVQTIKYLLDLYQGKTSSKSKDNKVLSIDFDDIDNLANRRIRTSGELIQNQFRMGLSKAEKTIRERMMTQDMDVITPTSLISVNSLETTFKEFFGLSELSQFMDQNNTLAGIAHKRKVSALGVGGLSRERAGVEVRDVHFSHYGRLCPVESPEGINIGLISSLATYARVNAFGFIETPYRVVKNSIVTDEIKYLTADDERNQIIARFNTPLDKNGKIANKFVDAKTDMEENETVEASKVTYMDVSPDQMVSVATSMIPFLDHNDGQRALMAANMQRQAVPLLKPDRPLVGTGTEFKTAIDSGETLLAEEDGIVAEIDANHVVVKNKSGRNKIYKVVKFHRTNQSTSFNQKIVVSVGDSVKTGDILANGPSVVDGDLSIGTNLLTAFMSWEGFNYEDAIILSEKVVRDDKLTSVHIEEFEVEAKEMKPQGDEEITREIPGVMSDAVANLDENGVIRIGVEVRAGDIIVGKIRPKSEAQLTPEEQLLGTIFGDKNKKYMDSSLKVPNGQGGIVVGTQILTEEDDVELGSGVHKKVKVFIAQKRKISEGDKLAGRHGNKGVIAKILPVEDMPFLEDGTPVDIVLNPLGVPRRMNIGQVLELHLGWIASQGWKIDDKTASWVKKLSAKAMEASPGTPVSVPIFNSLRTDEIKGLLKSVNANDRGDKLVGPDGKAQLYHGRSGKPFSDRCAVGYMYILKLSHMVDDKVHARATGPYSLVTQQPLGGKAQFGGQRFGEMEVWALESYGAAHTLQEMLTIKSDDVEGRLKSYEAIVNGQNISKPGTPESFKVLVKEIQSLGLDIKAFDKNDSEIEFIDRSDEEKRLEENVGISMPENFSNDEEKEEEK